MVVGAARRFGPYRPGDLPPSRSAVYEFAPQDHGGGPVQLAEVGAGIVGVDHDVGGRLVGQAGEAEVTAGRPAPGPECAVGGQTGRHQRTAPSAPSGDRPAATSARISSATRPWGRSSVPARTVTPASKAATLNAAWTSAPFRCHLLRALSGSWRSSGMNEVMAVRVGVSAVPCSAI